MCTVDIDWLCYIYIYILYIIYIYIIYILYIYNLYIYFSLFICHYWMHESSPAKSGTQSLIQYNTLPACWRSASILSACTPQYKHVRKDKQCQPEDDNNENVGKLKDHQTSESNFQAVQDTYTVTAYTKQTPKKIQDPASVTCLKADAKRPSRAACSSVSRASQNGALLNILRSSLKHFEAVWSTLKQLEETVGAGTVWSSLKLTGAKHSITWHNFEASRRRDSTSACLVSTSSTCPIVTAGITLSNSYVAKNRICKCQIKHAYILQHEE